MALIKCPECEKEISDQASTCPNCGCPVTKTGMAMFSEQTSYTPTKSKFPVVPVIVVAIIVILIGFAIYYINTKKPANVSEEMYSYGESAIKIVDDYIDNEISYDVANQKLSGISDSADYYYDNEDDNTKKLHDFIIKSSISLLDSTLYFEHSGKATYFELLDRRNELAEELNLDIRDE